MTAFPDFFPSPDYRRLKLTEGDGIAEASCTVRPLESVYSKASR